MLTTDRAGTPLGSYLDAATPGETTLVAATLAHTSYTSEIAHLVADRGYDSNAVRALLVQAGMIPVIPARSNNTIATHQDGRTLRRYTHRYVIERTFAWLGWFRRLLIRHERLLTTYRGFFHFACALISLRVLLK